MATTTNLGRNIAIPAGTTQLPSPSTAYTITQGQITLTVDTTHTDPAAEITIALYGSDSGYTAGLSAVITGGTYTTKAGTTSGVKTVGGLWQYGAQGRVVITATEACVLDSATLTLS